MQQTKTYKLNLIEKDDVFSPDALNGNAEKTEAALIAEAQSRAAGHAALAGRVTALEARRIMVGSYAGDGAAQQTIKLGFTPEAVLVVCQMVSGGGGYTQVYLIAKDGPQTFEKIVDGGFFVTSHNALNNGNFICGFIAVA